MVDTNKIRGQWGLWSYETCRSPLEIDLKDALDEIDLLRSGEKTKEEILEEREHKERVAHFTGKYSDED